MVTDNGSSVVADEAREFATNYLIEWKFNVPYSPWMGGFWERLVSCVKKCLKRTIGVRQITFIELQTLIFEIETILNNRPICSDYDDDINEVLTPNHLIFGRRLESSNLQGIETIEDEIKLSKREKHIERLRDYFWTIWRQEYVTALRESHKSTKQRPEIINKNDIVMIFDKSQPRHMWKLGRISELIPSKDGVVRAANVKCGSSGNVLSRPVNLLYPIEFCKTENDIPFKGSVDDEMNLDVLAQVDSNTVQQHENVHGSNRNENNVNCHRSRRRAAIIGEMNRKCNDNSN